MKKWAPYSSLIEQSICLEKMRYEKNKIEKPRISSDLANKINMILTNYHGQELKITYFYDGYLYEIRTTIKSINKNRKSISLNEGEIPFNAIIDMFDETSSNDFDYA